MKHPYLAKLMFLLLLTGLGFAPLMAQAQTGSVSGRVVDEKKEGIPGATVIVDGTTLGSSSNVDGTYSIAAVPAGPHTLIVSYVGYNTVRQAVTVVAGQNAVANAALSVNATQLSEAVVIGYGTQRRQDVTGSIATVDTRQFVRGQVTNPEQLVQGKVAGLNVTTNGGQPGAGSQIRIRGGVSINASNDPLIVIDGVPVANGGLAGAANPLSLINPNDIESFSVLKDASATAIYGSRAAAGVILITTKKGVRGEGTHVTFNSQVSVAALTKQLPVLSGDEFRTLVSSSAYQQATNSTGRDTTLGKANTNWQDYVYQKAITFDNNLSVSGSAGKVPYRVSYGNLDQQGIIRTGHLVRNTLALSVTPLLLNDRLRVDVNVKGTVANNRFADGGAASGAATYDPTRPATDTARAYANYGGYYEHLLDPTDPMSAPSSLAPTNPLALLNLRRDVSTVHRSIGNIQLDYKIPGIDGLRLNYNLGYDVQRGEGSTTVSPNSRAAYISRTSPGRNGSTVAYSQNRNTWLNEVYLGYTHEFEKFGRIDAIAGYSYQNFLIKAPENPTLRSNGEILGTLPTVTFKKGEYALQSYYTRLNYNFADRYLLTATVRADQSSRFAKDVRTGYFPAVGVAWRVKGESFLQDVTFISELKFRGGFGITGQQDIGNNTSPSASDIRNAFYGYIPTYTQGEASAAYQFGPTFVNTLRADPYIADRKWETTKTYNVGLDYGFGSGGRVTGTVDAYLKRSTDLLIFGPLAAGSNLGNEAFINAGEFENKGLEFAINTAVVQSEKVNWNLNFNASYNESKVISALGANLLTGDAGGIGNKIQVYTAGYAAQQFYVYKQKYDDNGRPVPARVAGGDLNAYEDLKADGTFNGDDLYRYKQPAPKLVLGVSSNLAVGNAYLNFSLRSHVGNYVYNNLAANLQAYSSVYNVSGSYFGNSLPGLGRDVDFKTVQGQSDYFVQDARFIRMDNITLGYSFPHLMGSSSSVLGLSLAVQNVFVLTPYKGLDPEIPSGIDNNFYPRPRTYTFGLNVSF